MHIMQSSIHRVFTIALNPTRFHFRRLHTVRPFLPKVATHLISHGHATFDNALSADTAAALRLEIDKLADQGHLCVNSTHIVRNGAAVRTFPKRNVYEAELNLLPPHLFEALPALASLREDSTIRTLLSVFAPRMTLHTHAIKIQRSAGQCACFPIHIDSAPSHDSRVVTALLYLHQWEDTHGGQLRVYESPLVSRDINPREGRLVLLGATGMHHRVLPASEIRHVITMWCSGTVRPSEESFPSDMSSDDRVAAILLAPKYRDMAFRLVFEYEWEQSLREAHEENVATDAIELHRTNLDLIRTRLPPVLCRKLQLPGHVDRVEKLLASPKRLFDVFRAAENRNQSIMTFRW